MQISTTYIAGIVAIIAFVLPVFGLDVADEGTLTNALQQMAGIMSTLYVFVGRYRAGGINAFGLRKTQ